MRRIFWRGAVAVGAVLALASTQMDHAARGVGLAGKASVAAPQFGNSQCVANVPRAWGQYKGGSAQSGLAFEDSGGTLRFLTNIPCGAVPVVALEIRRTGNSN